jgi:hypothetical protein
MAEYTRSVPKSSEDPDETIKAALEVILFQTKDGDEFVSFESGPDKVVLMFDGD